MAKELTDFQLEQYLLGESPEWVNNAVAKDPDARRRVKELQADNEAFFSAYPPEQMIASIEERLKEGEEREKRKEATTKENSLTEFFRLLLGAFTMRPALSLGAVATVAVLLALPIFLSGSPEISSVDGSDEYVRLKGLEPALSIYRQEEDGSVRELDSETGARAGDTLQIAYNSAGAAHGMIFSVDGRKSVTLHFPSSPFESDRLKSGGEVALPYAYVLDDSPRFELFFFVVAEEPIDVAGIITSIESYLTDHDAGTLDSEKVARIVSEAARLAPENLGVERNTIRKLGGS